MRILKVITVFVLMGVVFGQIPLQARLINSWSYDKLWSEADVVVVIEPLKTENNDGKQDLGDISTDHLQGLTTHFKVHGIFKGGPLGNEIVLKHFDYKPGTLVVDGALFIHFVAGPLKYKKTDLKNDKEVGGTTYYQANPCWLAFLKKAPDGSYLPVTGQYDASLSFKELHDPSFFIGE